MGGSCAHTEPASSSSESSTGAPEPVCGDGVVGGEELCDGAGFCLGVCPTGALTLENRETVPISKMATDLVNGIVAVEDERFYEHNGIDPIGIVRAAVSNLKGGDRQGASTITQQYIRQTVLRDEAYDISYARKVREAYLAMEVEKRHTKREILEFYLNTIYLGEGTYGAEAASRAYFAKAASELSLAQAALIAGLAQSPSRLDPYVNPDGAIARRNEVLDAMLSNGYIDKKAHGEAVATKLSLKRTKDPSDGVYAAPYFVAHVKKQLQQQFLQKDPHQ